MVLIKQAHIHMLPSYLFLRVTHLQQSLSHFMCSEAVSFLYTNLLAWLVIPDTWPTRVCCHKCDIAHVHDIIVTYILTSARFLLQIFLLRFAYSATYSRLFVVLLTSKNAWLSCTKIIFPLLRFCFLSGRSDLLETFRNHLLFVVEWAMKCHD